MLKLLLQRLVSSSFTSKLVLTPLELEKSQRQLYSTLPKETAQGIESVKRIAKEHGINGVYAPIIELFNCTDAEMIAVEVAAKGNLFNFVVDTDETASKVIKMYLLAYLFLPCLL